MDDKAWYENINSDDYIELSGLNLKQIFDKMSKSMRDYKWIIKDKENKIIENHPIINLMKLKEE